jgi:beta-lactamase regulating signal transducer with metallopeptidase domain
MNTHDALKTGLVCGDLAAKSCIVLLIAWVATRCLRHQSASSRHLVWLAGFCVLLVLPVFTLVVPGKQFPVIRESANSQFTPVQGSTAEMNGRLIDQNYSDSVELSSVQLRSDAVTLPVITEPAAKADRGWSGLNIMKCLMGLWLIGFAVVAARSIRGVLAVRRFRRQSSQPFPNRIGFTFASVARQVGVTRPWDLRLSTSRIPPAAMTWGIFHPVVLMPKDSDSWTQERLEAVLLHELAHVRRFDSVSQLIALAASALYWFNPLVWLCARAMRAEAESAADDTVIRMGIKPSVYASELLRIAAELGQRRQPYSHIGVSVMKQSKIESRVKAILDPSARRRRGVTVLESIATIAVAGIAMLPLGALRAGVFQQETPKPPTLVAPNQVAPPAVLAIPPIPVAPPAKLSPPCPRQVAPPARVASVAPIQIDEAIRQIQGQSQLMRAQIEEARAQLNRTQKEVERQRELIRRLQNIQLRLTESKRHANGKESLNALAYLQTELTVARAKLAQLEHLNRKGIISKDKVGQAEAELRKASDAYRQAEQALKMPLKTKG